MDVGMLIMPHCAKVTFEIDKEGDWLEGLDIVNEFFLDKDVYPTGPIIFKREAVGLGEIEYTVYIALNQPIQDIPEFNIEYVDLLEVAPTITERCFEEEEFDLVYKKIEFIANENGFHLEKRPYYHVMIDYPGGKAFEIHAEIASIEESDNE
ncbi:DUF5085 family protein [Staphylococcus lutrae]|uniref:DUF5085 domain-containing protein n=1 Tax=Staphylococcus lutrae TaxID=155085 RepID=A0AAC9WMI2_9STAP|nr:DUF5085 family protein [Staphylococcus lutrae]ARJ51002.1 DUF5085 domain-containing protein [Staphylococcus lutrae]PNZ37140.1 DUF5085 domain-containing protein [Staphylococcus lutrae]